MDGRYVYVERPVTWPEGWDNEQIELAMRDALRGQRLNPQVKAMLQVASDIAVGFQAEAANADNADRPGQLARANGGAAAMGEFMAAILEMTG